ncbi:MAG TPA: hypothetical protein VF618_15190 [Thermoanaerobaculia bacterium]
MALTFIVGRAADAYGGAFARAVDAALAQVFTPPAGAPLEPYQSEPVDVSGWRLLQQRVLRDFDTATFPQLTTVEAYQAVYVPRDAASIELAAIPQAADPLQIGSLPRLIEELRRFAAHASLPTDDVELMKLVVHYLEAEDPDADLDVQTYVQLMLSARQAVARGQALFVVV